MGGKLQKKKKISCDILSNFQILCAFITRDVLLEKGP